MKRLFLVFAAVLLAVPVLADNLQPETLNQEVKEYNALSTGEIDPGNHEVWKLYICGALIPNNNYNHEKEIFVTKLVPQSPYIVYLRINQLYNFLQPIPKVGDVVAVEGRILNHFNSTIEGSRGIKRIPVLYMYVENASNLPFEPAAAAIILGPQSAPTPARASAGTPVVAALTPVSKISAVPVTTTPVFFKADLGTPVH